MSLPLEGIVELCDCRPAPPRGRSDRGLRARQDPGTPPAARPLGRWRGIRARGLALGARPIARDLGAGRRCPGLILGICRAADPQSQSDRPEPRELCPSSFHRFPASRESPMSGAADVSPPGPVLAGLHRNRKARVVVLTVSDRSKVSISLSVANLSPLRPTSYQHVDNRVGYRMPLIGGEV